MQNSFQFSPVFRTDLSVNKISVFYKKQYDSDLQLENLDVFTVSWANFLRCLTTHFY